MSDSNNAPAADGELTETVAEAVGATVADDVVDVAEAVDVAAADAQAAPAATPAATAAPDAPGAADTPATSDPVLSPYEADVLSNVAAQLRDLFGAAGITPENVEKFAGNVRDAVTKGADKLTADETVEDAIDDIQDFFKKVNIKLNKFANDAVDNWNKSITDD